MRIVIIVIFLLSTSLLNRAIAQAPSANSNAARATNSNRRLGPATAAEIHRASPHQATAQNGTGRAAQAAIPRSTVPAHAHATQRTARRDMPRHAHQDPAYRAGPGPNGNAYGHQPRTGDQHGLARGHLKNGVPVDSNRQALRQRLAEIDRLRDDAVRRGDTQALAEADRLEHEARARHAHSTNHPALPPQTPAAGTPPANSSFTPGYGRLTAEQAHALHRDAKRPAEATHSPPPADGSFTPGNGRATAAGAPSRRLPPVNPPPAPNQPAGDAQPASTPTAP